MQKILQRYEQLKKHKERMRQMHEHLALKHKRGEHDQRSHGAWAEGMGGLRDGNVRGGGGRFESNSLGTFGNDSVSFGNRRSASTLTLANRRRASKVVSSKVANTMPSLRPERLATLPIAHVPIVRPDQRRKSAQEQQAEWKRRHRMTQSTFSEQGLVSPSAMYAVPIDARYDTFAYDTTNTNLFENPELIAGVDEMGNPSNFLDFHETQLNAITSRIEDVLDGIVNNGTLTEEKAQEMYKRLLVSEQVVRQAVMRKAAASFAMDVQGFVGGEVYSTDNVEFQDSMRMASEANQVMSRQYAIVDDIGNQISELPGVSESDVSFFENLTFNLIDTPYNKWTDAQMKHENVKFPSMSRLTRINPALASDAIERSIEQSSGASVSTVAQSINELNATVDTSIKSATNTDRLTMSLPALMSLLHPKIRGQLNRLMSQAIQYPTTENPSTVINTIPSMPLNPATQQSKQILSSLIDMMHTDGGMSDVSIVDSEYDNANGYFSSAHETMFRMGIPDVGNPVIGMVDTENRNQDLPYPVIGAVSTLAHELAHHMDSTALPFGVSYFRDNVIVPNTVTGDRTVLPYPMMTAIIGSAGGVPPRFADKAQFAPAILEIMNRYRSTVQSRNQQTVSQFPSFEQPRMKRFMDYLDQPVEVFARLYQQYAMMKLRDKLQAGVKIDGIDDGDRQRALESVEKHLTKKMGKSKSKEIQYFFDEADMPTDQLESIFSVMGWKLK